MHQNVTTGTDKPPAAESTQGRPRQSRPRQSRDPALANLHELRWLAFPLIETATKPAAKAEAHRHGSPCTGR